MTELSLDDVQRHVVSRELEGMGVAELTRRKASSHTRLAGGAVEFEPHGGA